MEAAVIKIHGQIGNDSFMPDPNDSFVTTYAKVFAQVASAKDAGATAFIFEIDSYGGYVEEAFAIAAFIEKLPNTVAVAKLVASAANIIYAACKSKQVGSDSKFMLHPAWVSDVYGNASELQKVAEELQTTDARMFAYIEERLGIESNILSDFVQGRETWFGASEASAIGYTNERNDLVNEKAIKASIMKYFMLKAKALIGKAMTLKLENGADIFVDAETEEAFVGAETNAPDGTHELEGGATIVVEAGKVTAYTSKELEAAAMESDKDKQIEEMAAKIAELESKLQEQLAQVASMKQDAEKAIAQLGEEVNKYKSLAQSNAKPPRRTAENTEREPLALSVSEKKMQEARKKAGIEK